MNRAIHPSSSRFNSFNFGPGPAVACWQRRCRFSTSNTEKCRRCRPNGSSLNFVFCLLGSCRHSGPSEARLCWPGKNGGDAIGGGAMSVEERRGSVRFQPETLCYARVYVRQSHVWIAHDALVIDFSESHIRVSTDVPVGDQYRLCQHDAEDVRRSIEIRRDASGVVFEYGEPVERPEIEQLTSDLSFLEPHYDLLEAYLPTA